MRSGATARRVQHGFGLCSCAGALFVDHVDVADDHQDQRGEQAGQYVVEHNSGATAHSVIDLADRPGLGDVEQAEQRERERRAPPGRGRGQHRDHHAGDLVPDDRRVIVHAEAARALAADPDAGQRRQPRSRPRSSHSPSGASASANASPTSDPNVPGANGASPEPKPSASSAPGRAGGATSGAHRAVPAFRRSGHSRLRARSPGRPSRRQCTPRRLALDPADAMQSAAPETTRLQRCAAAATGSVNSSS